ncbi:hypothetical protein CCGE531_13070 [Rhizobium sp. CCGE531]|nr:hypothetical protein CCGE531_13070 [Rhizobium sp. CCGE531]AYG73207.1 hypothetical protein CCGE532_12490 [Rhizobium sp. CCGE532]
MPQVLFSLPTIHTGSITSLPSRALAGSSRILKEKVPVTRHDLDAMFATPLLDQADRNISVSGAQFY